MEKKELSKEATLESRQMVLSFSFPYKLWMVVNIDACDFIYWNDEGTAISFDSIELDVYLKSRFSIFKIKTFCGFIAHLGEFQFEHLPITPDADEKSFIFHYKHEQFQRNRMDLLDKICPRAKESSGTLAKVDETERKGFNAGAVERMGNDLCFTIYESVKSTEKKRSRLKMLIDFNKENFRIKEKQRAAIFKDLFNRGRTSFQRRSARPAPIGEPQFEASLTMGVNAPATKLKATIRKRPYAGYYGDYPDELINKFCGDFLPAYEEGYTDRVKKIEKQYSQKEQSNEISKSAKVYKKPNPKNTTTSHTPNLVVDSDDMDPDAPVTEAPDRKEPYADMDNEIICEIIVEAELGTITLTNSYTEMEEILTFTNQAMASTETEDTSTAMNIDIENEFKIPRAESQRIDSINHNDFLRKAHTSKFLENNKNRSNDWCF